MSAEHIVRVVPVLQQAAHRLVYSPYCRDIRTNLPYGDYEYDAFNMQDKSYLKPEAVPDEKGMAILVMPEYNADTLYILRKRS